MTTPLLLQVDGTPGFPPRGVAGLGIVVRGARGGILGTHVLRAPANSNNEAEYLALIAGLELLLRSYPCGPVRCMSDSRIVVEQIKGLSAVRAEALKPLHARAVTLVGQFPQLDLVLIPRALNRLADALAWEALGGRTRISRSGR